MKKIFKVSLMVLALLAVAAIAVGAACVEHDYVLTKTELPTCTKKGCMIYSCSVCHNVKTEDIDELGHDWAKTLTTGEDGSTWYACSRCDEKKDFTPATKGSCGVALKWNFNESTGTLAITGSGAMDNYTRVKDVPWYYFAGEITKVTFSSNVTSIGDNAFSSLPKITSVTIPANVTMIGTQAFVMCGSLKTVTFEPGKLVSIGEGAFGYCSSLESITLPVTLKRIGNWAFSVCSLKTVEFPVSVIEIGYGAFDNCSSLVKATFLSAATKISDETAFPKTTTIYGHAGSTAYTYATTYERPFVSLDGGEFSPKFQQATLLLESDISIRFYLRKDSVIGADSVYAVFEKAIYDKDGNITSYKTMTVSDYVEKQVTSSKGEIVDCYVFTCSGIAAKEMASDVKATGYCVQNGVTYTGDPVNYSVLKYVTNQLKKDDAKFRTMLVDLLNYGTEAQKYFNYNTKNLANAGLTAEQQGYGTKDVEIGTVKASTPLDGATMKIRQATLLLEDKVKINYYLTNLSYTGSISDLTLKITYLRSGVTETLDVSGSDFVPSGEEYTVAFDALAAKEMKVPVTATLYKGNDPVSNTVTYSVESWCNSNKDSATLGALANSIIKYGNAAAAFFAN